MTNKTEQQCGLLETTVESESGGMLSHPQAGPHSKLQLHLCNLGNTKTLDRYTMTNLQDICAKS